MKIAYDCQGGDRAPKAIVEGALKARTEFQIEPFFYGDREVLIQLEGVDEDHIVHCSERISQEESPALAIRRKKDSAVVRALMDLKEERVDGAISAGSTGALLAGGMFIVGRREGIERAALPLLLRIGSQTKLLLDIGANMDASPSMLLSFAEMGKDYLKRAEGIENPSVALLNVGTEAGKGNKQMKEAYDLFVEQVPNFVGNMEARSFLFDSADVIVCDAFAGNILIKSVEGVIEFIQKALKEQLANEKLSEEVQVGLLSFAKTALGDLDYNRYGGVPLLGLKKPVFKAHGASDQEAIVSATRALIKMIE